jgi:putative methionine-R-sulfoxide reductase with GAF domain
MFNEDEKPEPQKESVVVDDSKPNEDEIEADSHSVLENVIPVKQISHGWKVIHGWMAVSCDDC